MANQGAKKHVGLQIRVPRGPCLKVTGVVRTTTLDNKDTCAIVKLEDGRHAVLRNRFRTNHWTWVMVAL